MKLQSRLFLILIFLFISGLLNVYAANTKDSDGIVTGRLHLNKSWNPVVYLSYISDFDEMYTISNNMIISESMVDSLGFFSIDISFLPVEMSLLRLHLVKKGDPPYSLIIGGNDENHIFLVGNQNTNIRINNKNEQSLFKGVTVSGDSYNQTFREITEIFAASNDSINSERSLYKKELIEKSTSEKLRFIADTCKNPLVSLYAIYKSNFASNYLSCESFYRSYLNRWKKNNSSYFVRFREQIPIKKNKWRLNVFFVLSFLLVFGFAVFKIILNVKNNRFKKLSIQERKILDLLKKGATNQQISEECNIGLSTVKSHVSNIYSKLNLKSRKDVMNLK